MALTPCAPAELVCRGRFYQQLMGFGRSYISFLLFIQKPVNSHENSRNSRRVLPFGCVVCNVSTLDFV